ncbi:uncharacterized protein LOC100680064 [Nasonia vitripennis]|uniref:HTH CENPB-type domain-containing protein n=1 Tax=Nasonia vitripennis TaxID=7425 RepID=A0A7M7PYY6_NASVI|nr:uncharacterized protein LOC100680064 [Nasonia vitripennis]
MPPKQRAYKLYNYSESDLERAVEKCKKGESLRKVAQEFSIPRSTLFVKLKGIVPLHAKKGPSTILFEAEEMRLVKWILDKARLGFPMHEDEVKVAVKKVLDDEKRDSIFKNNKPGDKWMKLFLKRHPEIKKKQTELISKSRASVTEEKLRDWFKEVRSYLEENNLCNVLERPESIFNGDETGLQLCPKSGKLLGPTKERNFYEISCGKEKECVTVLCSFSAAGASVPPMVMFPYKRIPAHLTKSVPADWSIGRSESGWMVSSTFYEYMANVFYPWCVQQKVQFLVIYFLDGHKSHLSLELSDFCIKHEIILVSLFPNATHIIQPCDVAVFRAVKYKWREAVQLYKQETQSSITKATFAPLFKKAFDQLSIDTIKSGFKKCGLYPFDPDAVDYDRCISARRQKIINAKASQEPLERSDFISAKKFLDFFIDEETLKKFSETRSKNQNCDDPVYFLWNSCIEKLQETNDDAEQQQHVTQDQNDSNIEELGIAEESQLVMQESANNIIHEEPMNSTDVTQVVILTAEEAMEVVNDNQDIDISSIPIIDLSNLSSVEELSVTADSTLNTSIDQSSDAVIIIPSPNKCDNFARSITGTSDDPKMTETHKTEVDIVYSHSSPSNKPILIENSTNFSSDTIPVDLKQEISSSDAWDKHLLWPSPPVSKDKTKKESKPMPCVLTCSQWREQQTKEKAEKERKALEAQEKALQRKIKKEEKEKQQQILREERERKRAERIKIKEEKIKIKEEKIKNKVENNNVKKQKCIQNAVRVGPLQAIDTNIQENIVPLDLSLFK